MDTPLISYKNVEVYRAENKILNNFSFSLAKGELVYITGVIGSGKTTFFKTIYADLPIYSGEAEVTGFVLNNIKSSKIPFLRRKIGIVFQDFKLIAEKTIKENLEFVLLATGANNSDTINNRISKTLEKVDLLTKIDKYPHQLSGGEKQCAVIARAIINNPELILADEPTGNLDNDSINRIMNILLELNRSGCAIIMATHNTGLINKYPARTVDINEYSVSAN
jgi:cell division transport system ATP-binding protein